MKIAELIIQAVLALIPVITKLVQDGIAGKDITGDELWQRIPHDTRTALDAEILTERRKAAGLPV